MLSDSDSLKLFNKVENIVAKVVCCTFVVHGKGIVQMLIENYSNCLHKVVHFSKVYNLNQTTSTHML